MKYFKITVVAICLLIFCISIAAAETTPAEPQVKLLVPPQSLLQPAIEFLAQEPVIDGRLDDGLRGLAQRPFAALVKMNPGSPDTKADYRLAYGSDFLYLFIDVEADKLICRDRGYQNGDGFILVLNRPLPDNATANELFMLGYHPTGGPQQPFAQMVWKRNDKWPFSPLSEHSFFCVNAANGHVGFEVLLRWTDVHPYHPWLADGIGFNLIFVKAIGDTDANYLAVNMSPAAGMEAFEAYSRLVFASPTLAAGTQCAAVLESGHLQTDEPLRVKIAAVSARSTREQINFSFVSGEGARVAGQTVAIDLEPGVSVREAILNTNDLAIGGYMVCWESRLNMGSGKTGLTILPPFDAATKEKECREASKHVSPGSLQTIRFLLAEIDREQSQLKPYDTCAGLRAKMERANLLLRAAAVGDDLLSGQQGFLRRAFLSQRDGTLQPYTIHVPAGLQTGKKYPALVYLHGSDSDDQTVKSAMRSCSALVLGETFVIAPYGRGPSNAFSRDHAQEDIREAVADALRHYSIDPARLVLTGFSMGGYGVYRTLYENPKMYAAAAVFSGQPNITEFYAPEENHPDFRRQEFLKPLRGMNIAVIHGGRDRNCPVEITTALVAAMKRNGIPVRFFLDREAGHEPPRDPAILEEFRHWLETAIKAK
jgi:predicted esterase